MAVQAQYPSNVLLLNRNVQDANDFSLQQHPGVGGGGGGGGGGGAYIEQSHMLFNNNNNGAGVNPRKRSREVAATTTTTATTMNSFNFSLQNQNQNQNNQIIDLSQLQNHQQQQPNVVSTGLRLSFGDQNHQFQQQQQQQNHHQQQIQHQQQQQPNTLVSILSEEFAHQFKQQSDELSYFLHSQGEQLRRTLAEKRQKHYRALLGAAEEAVTRRMREKEAEVEKAARKNAELEARAAQLIAEAQAWQAKARAQEAQAATLQAQIQQAMVGPSGALQQQDREEGRSGGDADDAESAYVDPVSERRVNSPSCKMCRTRVATMVLLPCRHLCVCKECDDVVQACPLCLSMRSASVEVYLT